MKCTIERYDIFDGKSPQKGKGFGCKETKHQSKLHVAQNRTAHETPFLIITA